MVTGASRGIGAAIAERFGSEGAHVALAARTAEPSSGLPGSLRETADRIRSQGGKASCFVADMADPLSRASLVDAARSELGDIDILVNNAAASFYRPFAEWTERRFQVAIEVNVRAPFDLAQRLVAGMRSRGCGWIVNISSKTALHPAGPPYGEFHRSGGDLLYGMTKAALDRASTGLAAELYEDGIVVNSLAPVAAVMTPGVEALGVVPEAFQQSAEPVEAMAEAALALCAPGAPTGRILYSVEFLREIGRSVRGLDGNPL